MTVATASAPTSSRDHRVDFYRGIALAMIFVNHIPGTVFEDYTSRNFGFSDAAEIFVFLAGFASAFAYARRFLGGARLVTSLMAWRRAGVLYLVHVTLTVIAVGLFAWAALAFGQGAMMRQFGLEMFLDKPIEALVGTATLGHQLGYVNILPMYSVLLLGLPLMLVVVERVGSAGLLVVSMGLWFLAGAFVLDMPMYPVEGGWFFNPLAWQVLFAAGLASGLSKWRRGYTIRYNRWLFTAALAYLAFAFVCVRLNAYHVWPSLGLPVLLADFDKTYVAVPRLLHVLALVYVFANASAGSPLGRISRNNPFTRLGRHSLPVFAVGTVLSLVAQVIRFGETPSVFADAALIAAGLGMQFALAAYLDWWRRAKLAGRSQKASTASDGGVQRARQAFRPRATDGRSGPDV